MTLVSRDASLGSFGLDMMVVASDVCGAMTLHLIPTEFHLGANAG